MGPPVFPAVEEILVTGVVIRVSEAEAVLYPGQGLVCREPGVFEGEQEGEMQLGPGWRRHVEGAPGPQWRETQRRGHERARPVGPEVVIDDRERPLRLARIAEAVWGVGPDEVDGVVAAEAGDILCDRRVPAHQHVAAERPCLATLDVEVGLGREVRGRIEVTLLDDPRLREERRNVVGVVSRRGEVVLGLLLGEDRGEERVVVPAQVGGPVVRKHESDRLGVVEVLDVGGDLGPA